MGLDGWYGEHMRTLDKRRDEHQAKDAVRLEPKKALERVQGLENTLSWTPNAPGGERAPHPCVSTLWNVVSPYRSFRKEGKEVVRSTEGGAGKGVGKSEGRPVMGRIRVATSPAAQAG